MSAAPLSKSFFVRTHLQGAERVAFFGYLVLLRSGGVFADADAECRRSFDSLLRPSDTLLAGWDSEAADKAQAAKKRLFRTRQVCGLRLFLCAGMRVFLNLWG